MSFQALSALTSVLIVCGAILRFVIQSVRKWTSVEYKVDNLASSLTVWRMEIDQRIRWLEERQWKGD